MGTNQLRRTKAGHERAGANNDPRSPHRAPLSIIKGRGLLLLHGSILLRDLAQACGEGLML